MDETKTQQIARMYGVPPHMIGDSERATGANMEDHAIAKREGLREVVEEVAREATSSLDIDGLAVQWDDEA